MSYNSAFHVLTLLTRAHTTSNQLPLDRRILSEVEELWHGFAARTNRFSSGELYDDEYHRSAYAHQ